MTGSDVHSQQRRRAALAALAAGTTCLLGALAVAGAVGAVALDALTSGAGDAGGCMGAVVLPMAMLAGSAVLGMFGAGLVAAGGMLFWRLTAPPSAVQRPADGGE